MALGLSILGTTASVPVWLAAPKAQAQLAAGKVVVHTVLDSARSSASMRAAVRIDAAAPVIWRLITTCKGAAVYIRGLRRCKVLRTGSSWAIVEHDIKESFFLPTIRSIFRASYRPPYRMDFRRVGGNLKAERGSWLLEPSADGTYTTVLYRISMVPGFWVPRALVRHSLAKSLRASLRGLQRRAQRLAAGTSVAAR